MRGGRRKGAGRKPFLKLHGISKASAYRWRIMAAVPDDIVRRLAAVCTDAGKELSSSMVYRIGLVLTGRRERVRVPDVLD